MEIKKGFLQGLVYLHGKCVRCESIDEVFEVISNLSATPRRHLLGTVLEAIVELFRDIRAVTPSDIIDKYGDIPVSQWQKNQCKNMLRNYIRTFFKKVDKMVDEIVNPMNCFVDIQPPRLEGEFFNNAPRLCTGSQRECNIKQFFIDNAGQFTKIRDKLKSQSKKGIDTETQQRITSLSEILRLLPYNRKFSNKEPNVKNCWRCGDAILAVTVSSDADVLNHNKKHYESICEAIGKKSISY